MSPDKLSKFALALVFGSMFFVPARAGAAEQPVKFDISGMRNPFVPLVSADGRLVRIAAGTASGDLIVQGIIYDEKGPSYAIVNSAVVKPGDAIDGWNVYKIEENKVIISRGSQYRELELEKTQ